MLAYPTPTFDAKTILQAPGFRPTGKSGGLVYQEQPEAITAPSLVNRHTANGGFVGTRAKKFIQDNQFNTSDMKFDPMRGTPLSKPGSVGNVDAQAIGCQPKYAEPQNGELKAILNILNGKPQLGEVEKLSAQQLASLERKAKPVNVEGARKVVEDFSDAREATRKASMIQKAVRQGFSKDEAEEAYKRMRVKEAEATLFKEDDPSVRLYDLIDSRVGGTQDGSIRSNDETGLFLAKGGNAVMETQAVRRNAKIDKVVGGQKSVQATPKFDPVADLINRFKALPKASPQLLLEDIKPDRTRLSAKAVTELQTVNVPRSLQVGGAVREFLETGKPIEVKGVPQKKKAGRPAGAKDVKPRTRPSGLRYERKPKQPEVD